jgi:uncharacterized protein involved in type VI secretion and phage assembly
MSTPEVILSIDGQPLNTFSSFYLNQSIYDHHTFQLVVGHDIVEDLGAHVLDNSKKWLGKQFAATFGDNEFIGVITSVSMDHFHGLNGDLIIRGASPTVFLDAGPHKQSWNDKGLKNVVEDVCAAAGVAVEASPALTEPITYLAQYRESHFQYLQRLAAVYNEWMYYDGKTFYFGKPEPGEAIPVSYGRDLESLQISMRMLSVKVKGFSYNSMNDENLDAPAPGTVTGLNDLGTQAMNASLEHYGIEPQSSVRPRVEDKGKLEKNLANRQAATAARMATIKGRGTVKELKPGAVIDISAAVRNGMSWETMPYGKYLVLNIRHHITGNYEYSHQFEAIPAELEVPPEPDIELPVAEPQIATVLSNTDPEGKGRVQVKFLWQSGDMKSPWVRVMTPDAGTSDKVASNRGMVTIPEVGDQVMMGFRYNDPQRPFVLGSMFHGNSGGGGGAGNASKSLTTRSGATVTINDDEGQGTVTISDPSGNVITMHGDGKMSIHAPNELNLSSTLINIKASEKVFMEGIDEVEIHSTKIVEKADTTFEIESGADMSVKSVTMDEAHTNYTLEAEANVDINGTAMTNIKGGMLNLN